MDIFQSAEGLVEEGLKVRIGERLSRTNLQSLAQDQKNEYLGLKKSSDSHDGVKISFHEFFLYDLDEKPYNSESMNTNVEVDFIKVPSGLEDDVHVVQASDLMGSLRSTVVSQQTGSARTFL
jgi:hypothetical protein